MPIYSNDNADKEGAVNVNERTANQNAAGGDMEGNLNQMDANAQMGENADLNGIIFTSEGLEYDSTLEMGAANTTSEPETAAPQEQTEGGPAGPDLSKYSIDYFVNLIAKGSMGFSIKEGNPPFENFENLEYRELMVNAKREMHYTEGAVGNILIEDLYVSPDNLEPEIHHNDVDQNSIGNCYFMASLAALAQNEKGRAQIKELITGPKEDGNYEVKLYLDGEWKTFNVTPEFPGIKSGEFFFFSLTAGQGDGELWVLILEKALAMASGGYFESQGGHGEDAINMLTGKDTDYSLLFFNDDDTLRTLIKSALDEGRPIVAHNELSEKTEFVDDYSNKRTIITPNHVYTVMDMDEGGTYITLFNPHNDSDASPDVQGGNYLTISFDNFDEYFFKISYQE